MLAAAGTFRLTPFRPYSTALWVTSPLPRSRFVCSPWNSSFYEPRGYCRNRYFVFRIGLREHGSPARPTCETTTAEGLNFRTDCPSECEAPRVVSGLRCFVEARWTQAVVVRKQPPPPPKLVAWPRQDCFTEARHVHVEMAELIKLRQRQEE